HVPVTPTTTARAGNSTTCCRSAPARRGDLHPAGSDVGSQNGPGTRRGEFVHHVVDGPAFHHGPHGHPGRVGQWGNCRGLHTGSDRHRRLEDLPRAVVVQHHVLLGEDHTTQPGGQLRLRSGTT